MSNCPRIMFVAPNSGGGKTTVTCGVLQALVNRKMKVASFKCGPDYIDPMFHSKIIGTKSRNLDLFFTDENMTRALLKKNSENMDISVIEGVMGYYDGLGGVSTSASSYDLSRVTQTPVIMVIKPKGASVSVAAIIKGMIDFRENSNVCGVILNECSENLYKMLAPMIEKELNIPVFGFLPKLDECAVESRHLGLVTANEIEDLQHKMQRLAEEVEKNIRLDEIVKTANSAPNIDDLMENIEPITDVKPIIAVAKDNAFCFYYEDNLELLRSLGAEIIEFSPINDKKIPDNANAIYLGGGYPELYLEKLSSNTSMLESVKNAISSSMPTVAECGGFMYLHEGIIGKNSEKISMVGACKGVCNYIGKLQRFGYITLTGKENTILCEKNGQIAAHEFHYFDSENNGNAFIAEKPLSSRKWECVNSNENLFAGFPHLYFYSNIDFARNFVKKATQYKEGKI